MTAWIGIAKQYICETDSCFAAKEPTLHNGGNLFPPRHANRITADIDVNGVLVDRSKSGNELVLVIRKLH